jgi:GT2 family glycosyltransferase
MSRTTVSLVLYKSNPAELEPLLRSLTVDRAVSSWVVVDNSAAELPGTQPALRALVESLGGQYVPAPSNVGFGAGHNLALKALAGVPSDFHLLLNPDITFDATVLPALETAMDNQGRVALMMPQVLFPGGENQYLCKLLPTPLDFALRRFAPGPLQKIARGRMDRYELREMDLHQPAQIPFLSGCFMFLRRSVFEEIGGFDKSYFLYMEDVDLCRRIAAAGELLYWPAARVTHVHQRGSHTSIKLMFTHLRSAITYFNKWGWFFDTDRSRINKTALARIASGQRNARLL